MSAAGRRSSRAVAAALVAAVAVLAVAVAPARAAAPPACGPVQIADANGDGHHASTDILSAWFSEAGGLTATLRIKAGSFEPEHSGEGVDGSGFAMLFELGGRTAYVRAVAPPPGGGAVVFDHGSFDGTRFASAGLTTGWVERAAFGGTVTIAVPAALGAVPGTVLARPFALTYDGTSLDGAPHWVDAAPGGTGPADAARGADFVVGTCAGAIPADRLLAVALRAPSRVRGPRSVRVSGAVVPARAGVPVEIERRDRRRRLVRVRTAADGSFSIRLRVAERTRLTARAGGLASATATVTVGSTARARLVRVRHGAARRIVVRFAPPLPGKVMLLRSGSPFPAATRRAGKRGRVVFAARGLRAGRYEAVYVPSRGLATRSTSNAVRVGGR